MLPILSCQPTIPKPQSCFPIGAQTWAMHSNSTCHPSCAMPTDTTQRPSHLSHSTARTSLKLGIFGLLPQGRRRVSRSAIWLVVLFAWAGMERLYVGPMPQIFPFSNLFGFSIAQLKIGNTPISPAPTRDALTPNCTALPILSILSCKLQCLSHN